MAARPMSTPLVGRAAELGRLREGLARAAAGEPSVLLLAGDAGVGKTRLLREAAVTAEARGAVALVAHCVDLGDVGLPYLPFAEALAHLRDAEPEAVAAAVASHPALARLLPGGAGEVPEDGSAQRLQLFDGVLALLTAVGAPGRPVLLALEDLHWADDASRDLLRFVTARLGGQHVLLVGTYRTDDLHRRHPWRPVLAELLRHPRVERVELPPLDPAEVRALARQAGPLPAAVVERVVERAEGNAFYAEQLLLAGAGPELPGTLADVLRGRVERLDPAAQSLARVAAAAGRRVTEPLLRGAAVRWDPGLPFDASLREAVASHVLVVDEGHVAFRHALLGEAVAADLLPGEVSALHRAYLRALADEPALGSASEVAAHALLAPDLPAALVASRRAADEARELLAPAVVLRHLETVLRLWDGLPDAAELLGEPQDEVLAAASRAAGQSGRVDRAVQLARAAVAATPGVLRAAEHRTQLARHLLAADRVPDALRESTRAVADLAGTSGRAAAWALATHARVALNLDHEDEAELAATEAVALARAVGAPDAESDAATTLAAALVGEPTRALEMLTAALAAARRSDDVETELRVRYNLGMRRFEAGALDEAAADVAEGLARARAAGATRAVYGVQLDYLDRLVRYHRGDLAPVGAPADVDDDLAAVTQAVDLYAAVARGDEDAVARGLALRPAWARDGLVVLVAGGCTADALTRTGRPAEALGVLAAAVEHLERLWSPAYLAGIWHAALGLAAWADLRAAGHDAPVADGVVAVEALRERAERTAARGPLGPEGRAWLLRARAEHARATGVPDVAAWRAAAEAFDYGYRVEAARSRHRLAEALLAVGDRDGARGAAAAALAEAEATGAVPLAAAVRDLCRRARLDVPGTRAPVADVLTAREAEVLALAAQGLSNRQIGERLYISGKTVSVHVSNVLAKLGASGRTEAVALAHRRGLLDA
ncbi:helix-turn-helix transcriptional regulator [Cellulomonas endophytica]|uniref:helix-turn-helix transcriptional regulator n=1 Tax=Cellulomonas endophytica TaxID=2494735 RepID=UPI001F0BE2C6|nr:LuxR family transcriptional regulator [Cellulomonas endophytica]